MAGQHLMPQCRGKVGCPGASVVTGGIGDDELLDGLLSAFGKVGSLSITPQGRVSG